MGMWAGADPWDLQTEAGSGVFLDFCMSDEMVSESHIFPSC